MPRAATESAAAAPHGVLGRFLEIGLQTPDIRASVEFHERLGFSHCVAGDAWAHPYGVLTDGRLVLGLHQHAVASPSIIFARADLAAQIPELQARGIAFERLRTGSEVFNEIGFCDPAGQSVTVLEARTYSPGDRRREEVSLCGDFVAFSMPAHDFQGCAGFWEGCGFVALEEQPGPWPHMPLTSDHLDLALHPPQNLARPALVFAAPDMRERIARLCALGLEPVAGLPRGLDAHHNALFESPEGMAFLLLTAD